MAVFHEKDGRWHDVLCANCGWELYSSLPRTGRTVNWYHICNTTCPKAEPTAKDVMAMKAHSTHGYHLTKQDGKAVQEVLRRYVGELRELDPGVIPDDDDRTAYSQQLAKDISYIESLAKLFD